MWEGGSASIKKESVRRPAQGRREKKIKMNKKLKKRDRGGVDDYPDALANMTAKKYNKKHRVLDLDARDAPAWAPACRRAARHAGRRVAPWGSKYGWEGKSRFGTCTLADGQDALST